MIKHTKALQNHYNSLNMSSPMNIVNSDLRIKGFEEGWDAAIEFVAEQYAKSRAGEGIALFDKEDILNCKKI